MGTLSSRRGLSCRDLCVGALANVDLTVAPGEIVCLSGASGSGKTRLLRALADLDPHSGTVALDGVRQEDVPGHVWRQQVMVLPAEAPWWLTRVGEHFPDLPESDDLAAIGLPFESLEWPVTRLSSGERQRAALLRALAHAPRALLLDEPTANLDPETTRAVEHWLSGRIASAQLPTLWVAHDADQVRRVAHRHLRLHDGVLEAVPWK